jgi:hypothetical protein
MRMRPDDGGVDDDVFEVRVIRYGADADETCKTSPVCFAAAS